MFISADVTHEVSSRAEGRAERLIADASWRSIDGSARGAIAGEVGSWSTEEPKDAISGASRSLPSGSPEDAISD